MNDWGEAHDLLTEAIDAATSEQGELTVEQRFKVAEIRANLAVAQEINHLRHYGVNPEYEDR